MEKYQILVNLDLKNNKPVPLDSKIDSGKQVAYVYTVNHIYLLFARNFCKFLNNGARQIGAICEESKHGAQQVPDRCDFIKRFQTNRGEDPDGQRVPDAFESQVINASSKVQTYVVNNARDMKRL